MNYALINNEIHDSFPVVDRATFNMVGGIDSTSFAVTILDPDGDGRVDGTGAVDWSIQEKGVGTGFYTLSFTPDQLGEWIANVVHDDYFPYGKSMNYEVVPEGFFSSGGDSTSDIAELLDICDDIVIMLSTLL